MFLTQKLWDFYEKMKFLILFTLIQIAFEMNERSFNFRLYFHIFLLIKILT